MGMRVLHFSTVTGLVVSFAMVAMVPAAIAKHGTKHHDGEDRYQTCQRRAQQVSGYYGPVPESHLPPGALHGAARGAAGGALIGVIGGSGVDTGKAAGRGAAIGAVAGGVRRAQAKSANDRKRDAYQFEVNACMSAKN